MSGWVFEEIYKTTKRSSIRGITKAKKYLQQGQSPPPGKNVMTGPKGGKYYETGGEYESTVGELGGLKTGEKIVYDGDYMTVMAFDRLARTVTLRGSLRGEGVYDVVVPISEIMSNEGGIAKPEMVESTEIIYEGQKWKPDSVKLNIIEKRYPFPHGEERIIPFIIEDWNVSSLEMALRIRGRLNHAWANNMTRIDEALAELNEIRLVRNFDTHVGKYPAHLAEPGVIEVQTTGFAGQPEDVDVVEFNTFFVLGRMAYPGYDNPESYGLDEFDYAEWWAEDRVGKNPGNQRQYDQANEQVKQMKDRGEFSKRWMEISVADYTGHRYEDINAYLRGEIVEGSPTSPEGQEAMRKGIRVRDLSGISELKMRVNAIDEFLALAPKYEGYVWRGMGLEDEGDLANWEVGFREAMEEGKEWTFPQYLSCSMRKSLAHDFMRKKHTRGVLFRIYTKNGVPVDGLGPSFEQEVLVGRDTKFTVKAVRRIRGRSSEYDALEVVLVER